MIAIQHWHTENNTWNICKKSVGVVLLKKYNSLYKDFGN